MLWRGPKSSEKILESFWKVLESFGVLWRAFEDSGVELDRFSDIPKSGNPVSENRIGADSDL